MPPNFEIAYAKINLTLHVRNRRDDGYHELESLVAFYEWGDFLEAKPADVDHFSAQGEFANDIGTDADNLVMRALRFAREYADFPIPPMAISLSKHIPVAAGLGGGSADAAALLRLLLNHGFIYGPSDLALAAAALGADVPACLYSQPLIMRGIGEKIEFVEDDSLTDIFVVLVNPRLPVPTGPVFKAWDQIDRGGLGNGSALEIAMSGRNDLETPAIALCPAIGDVLAALEATSPIVARMSGSGATCFALYDDAEKCFAVEKRLNAMYPDWWIKAGSLTRCR
jgi:4-diphosphocytidyl-2-C-methyl-D-erythritol kinase